MIHTKENLDAVVSEVEKKWKPVFDVCYHCNGKGWVRECDNDGGDHLVDCVCVGWKP